MIRTINLDDKLDINDLKDALSQRNSQFLRGEAEFYNEHGDLLFKRSNLIVLPGKVFALEKLFNVKCKTDIPDLKEQLNIPASTPITANEDKGPLQKKAVCLFGVGMGGSSNQFGDVIKPNFSDTNLYNMVPFRYVPLANDLTPTEKKKYFFRVETQDDMVAYFLKKFDKTPSIEIKRLGTDIDADISIKDEEFDVYVEMELKIDVEDIREYFNAIGEGHLARYNEICLVYGVQPDVPGQDYVDYEQLELFSKLTFNNEALDSVSKELRIIYRVY